MKKYNKVLDYLIDQSNKYDSRNLQIEEDIKFLLKKEKAKLDDKVFSHVRDIDSVLAVTQFMDGVTNDFTKYYNTIAKIFDRSIITHYNSGYEQTEDLINMGKEINGKLSEGVKEIKYNKYDEDTIEFIKKHAMELAKGYSDGKINQIRSTVSNLMLQGKANKATVRTEIQKILDTGKSKAEEIAQTELSRAYNYGVLSKLNEYSDQNPQSTIRKYWHGFAYSENTCTYCRARIGNIYDINDNSETLPAHVRCRCVWLPIMDGWDKPVTRELTNRANMLNATYSDEYIYNRINNRLGINYANYMSKESAIDYLAGDRSEKVMDSITRARDMAISDIKANINIKVDTDNNSMSNRFNTQLAFWKDMISTSIVDNDKDTLNKSYEAIKAVMLLPWNVKQLSKWNDLLNYINREL